MHKLTIFYDGHCPLCLKEMAHLKLLDTAQNIELVDVQTGEFQDNYPEIDKTSALAKLHGYLTGEEQQPKQLLIGLDVTYHAWRLVGKGYWIAPLRWPIIKHIADLAYLAFAKNRYRLSYLLTGKRRCYDCKL